MVIRGLTAVSSLARISARSLDRSRQRDEPHRPGPDEPARYLAREHVLQVRRRPWASRTCTSLTVLFEAIKASCKIARERGETFGGFEESEEYASGEDFTKLH